MGLPRLSPLIPDPCRHFDSTAAVRDRPGEAAQAVKVGTVKRAKGLLISTPVPGRVGHVKCDRARQALVPLTLLVSVMLSACTPYQSAGSDSQALTCSEVFDLLLDDPTPDGATIDWLGANCDAEYETLTDYWGATVMVKEFGVEPCEEWGSRISRDAVTLLYREGLCSDDLVASLLGDASVGEPPGGGIWWDQAIGAVGTSQRVCGPLVNSGTSEDDVFLNLGLGYPEPGRFTIVIWDIGGIEPIPYGVTLCTTGVITLYEGVAEIELRAAEDVEIYS